MTDNIILIKELADYLKLKVNTIYRIVSKGDILVFKIERSWRFEKLFANISLKSGGYNNVFFS